EGEALILMTQGSGAETEDNGDDRPGFVFVVTKDKVAWSPIGRTPAELRADIARLRAQIDPGGAARRPQETEEAPHAGRGFGRGLAKGVHDALFADPAIADALAGKDEWLLVPQGDLLSLPFAAL